MNDKIVIKQTAIYHSKKFQSIWRTLDFATKSAQKMYEKFFEKNNVKIVISI